jgi:anti-sigma regulatory factor (Ser/Thr protein kinase)
VSGIQERPHGPHEISLDLPAAHSAGRMARRMVREFALSEGVPEDEVQTLEFVTGELLDNAVDHGGGGGVRDEADLTQDVRMQLFVGLSDATWHVLVEDQGGAEPDELRRMISPPDGLPDLESDRGRGFFLLAQMVDRLVVNRSSDGLGLAFEAFKGYGDGRGS